MKSYIICLKFMFFLRAVYQAPVNAFWQHASMQNIAGSSGSLNTVMVAEEMVYEAAE